MAAGESQKWVSRGPRPVGPANLKDVALRAGVSTATASRVFSSPDLVRQQTRDRVLTAADELGYVVNGLARMMMGQGRRTVAILVAHMVGPTFASLAGAVERVSAAEGHLFLLSTTQDDPVRERELIDTLREQRAAAVLLVGSAPMDDAYIERVQGYARDLATIGARLVLCGRPAIPGHPDLLTVNYEQSRGIGEAVEHLVALGHQRIAYIGQAADYTTPEQRLEGYKSALVKAGLAVDDRLIQESDNVEEAGTRAAQELLDRCPDTTAIVCMTDNIAVGVYRATRARGLTIPDDLSVIGFDDTPLVGDLTPGLTTVRAPFEAVGRMAAELALGLPHSNEPLITELVVRGSTAAPR
ncbi:MAG: hypothetical protein JWP75_1853 [Frondihabitans sp.]|nr:hypothetical protein [Frondihabitans sp.]